MRTLKRQLLIETIKELKSKEKSIDIFNDEAIFKKYPEIKEIFEQTRFREEQWHQVVREVVYMDKNSILYMYNRTMQLIRRIGADYSVYFKIKTELGTYVLPDRLSDFNRLLELYEEFFYDLFPKLIRTISLEMIHEEHKSRLIKGNINWAKTLSDPDNIGFLESPIYFIQSRPKKEFNIPENIILILTILQMKYEAKILSEFNFSDPLTISEHAILEKIVEGCNQASKLTMLQDLIPSAKEYLAFESTDYRILSLESKVYQRTKDYSKKNMLIRSLLEWRKKYRELNIRLFSFNITNFPLDHSCNVDKMYELWILFELLDFLQEQGTTINVKEFPAMFEFSYNTKKYTLIYDKACRGWCSIGAQPDYRIEKDGKRIAIMDAKNWLFEKKNKAIYKMLGYMNNLDSSVGVLFFPNELKLPKEKLQHGIDLWHHTNQHLFNCILFPSNSQENHKMKKQQIKKIFDLIMDVE